MKKRLIIEVDYEDGAWPRDPEDGAQVETDLEEAVGYVLYRHGVGADSAIIVRHEERV